MIETLFHAYAATALSRTVQHSRWIFAVFEMVHLVGLSLVGGTVVIVSARLAGWPIAALDRAAVWRALRGVLIGGLIVQIASGMILVAVNPMKYYYNPSFNAKLWLLLAAVATGIVIDRLIRRDRVPVALWCAIAALLAGLTLSVAVAGRAIGLL